MIKLGSIIFYKNIPTFLSWVQRVLTNTIYSHTSISIGILTLFNKQVEFEADIKVRLHSFDKRTENMDVLELIDVPYKTRREAIKGLLHFDGRSYGYIQWLAIFLRFTFKRMGFKNTHKWNILWGWGTTCSELVYWYLRAICPSMMRGENQWYQLWYDLYRHNPDTFVPQDIADLAKKYPECMRWV